MYISPLGNILMGTAVNEYFSSGVNIINGQVIKTENVTQYFNGSANQYNSNQQSLNFDNIAYNTTSSIISFFLSSSSFK
jgi:hypothetical protein